VQEHTGSSAAKHAARYGRKQGAIAKDAGCVVKAPDNNLHGECKTLCRMPRLRSECTQQSGTAWFADQRACWAVDSDDSAS
jgi:hypothetical protein